MKKIIFMMCAILATTMMAKAEDECKQELDNEVNCGDNITVVLTASPVEGKYLTGWKDQDGNTITPDAEGKYTITSISKDMTFIAQFGDQYKLTINCTNGQIKINGEVKENGDYYFDPGTEIVLAAIPTSASCYTFSKWKKDGTVLPDTEETLAKFELNSNAEYSAIYDLNTYSVSVQTAGDNGEVCIKPAQD